MLWRLFSNLDFFCRLLSPSPLVMGDPHPPPSAPLSPDASIPPASSSLLPTASSPTKLKSFAALFLKPSSSSELLPQPAIIPLSTHRGEIAFKIPQTLVDQFAKPFKHTLWGGFHRGALPWRRLDSVLRGSISKEIFN